MEGEAAFHCFYVGLSFFVLPGPKRGALPVHYLTLVSIFYFETGSYCVTEAALELAISLPQPLST